MAFAGQGGSALFELGSGLTPEGVAPKDLALSLAFRITLKCRASFDQRLEFDKGPGEMWTCLRLRLILPRGNAEELHICTRRVLTQR